MNQGEDFYKQLNHMIEARVREKGEFDKKIFYAITSLFAFSIALAQFLNKPISHPKLLIWSWIFNISALMLHLLSYWFIDRAIRLKKDFFITGSLPSNEMLEYLIGKRKTKWDFYSEASDNLSFLLFFAAITFLAFFAYFNLLIYSLGFNF